MSDRSGFSTSTLVDLIMDPRDPGYAAAAQRARRRTAWADRPLVALGCLLVGFTIALGYVDTHRSAPEAASVQRALVARVRAAQSTREQLEQTADRLAADINRARDNALSGSSGLRKDLDRSQLVAGAVAVNGPGVEVRLADPPSSTDEPTAGRGGTRVGVSAGLLTDRDVRSVVNELWNAGAESIAVNGVRLTATSAIRFAGQTVLVDFQPIASPYVVRAIGDRDALITRFADSEVASRYQTLAAARGIGFSFSEVAKLSLPASGPQGARVATPATTPSPRPTR